MRLEGQRVIGDRLECDFRQALAHFRAARFQERRFRAGRLAVAQRRHDAVFGIFERRDLGGCLSDLPREVLVIDQLAAAAFGFLARHAPDAVEARVKPRCIGVAAALELHQVFRDRPAFAHLADDGSSSARARR